jgi:hypothetical protein
VATWLYVTAAAVAAAIVIVLQSDLTFWADEWVLLAGRPDFGMGAVFEPHNEHIVAAPALIYRALLELFGMDSPRPFQLVGVALHLATVSLLFVYVRRRCGDWLALAFALPLLVLGSSWLNLLFPFQIAFTGALACGLGALLMLDREDRRGDVVACALLLAGLAFNALALAFCAAVAVVTLGRDGRLRRAYVYAVPVVAFGLWWLAYGSDAETSLTLGNIATSPLYILDGIASSISSLLGFTGSQTGDAGPAAALTWGRSLAVVAIALAIWRLRTSGGAHLWLLACLAALLAFWFLVAANRIELRPATSGRYQYVGAVLLILVTAELLRGVRLPRPALAAAVAAGAVAAGVNLAALDEGRERLVSSSEYTRGALTGVELARDHADPELALDSGAEISPLYGLTARSYLQAVDRFGSPAYALEDLGEMPERSRAIADQTAASALAIEMEPSPANAARDCETAAAGEVTLPAAGAVIRRMQPGVELRLRRLAAESFPVELGAAAAGASILEIPEDRLMQPWQLQVSEPTGVEICALGERTGG